MVKAKLLVDTNIYVDYLHERAPFYDDARKLMIAGRVGEFSLWLSSSQVTDLVYILSNGGKKSLLPDVLKKVRKLREFIHIYAVSDEEINNMLNTIWEDAEDALLYEVALAIKADAIITRDKEGFEESLIKVMDCTEFFDYMETEFGISYDEVAV